MQRSMPKTMIEPASVRSLSKPTTAWVIMIATVMKGLQIARRYVPNLVANFVQLALRIAFFLLMSLLRKVFYPSKKTGQNNIMSYI